MAIQYDPELLESSDDSSEIDVDAAVDPGLRPGEFVLPKVNIMNTLLAAFWVHAKRHQTPGTFPLYDDDAVHEVRLLADEFLSDYHLPSKESTNVDEWECPRFVAEWHLV
jgi:hypothetical protein